MSRRSHVHGCDIVVGDDVDDLAVPLLAVLATAALNVPFGYWRAGLRKLSPLWFVAIHAPIPLVIGLRLALDVPLRLSTLPLFVAAFFTGQWLGGRLRRSRSPGN